MLNKRSKIIEKAGTLIFPDEIKWVNPGSLPTGNGDPILIRALMACTKIILLAFVDKLSHTMSRVLLGNACRVLSYAMNTGKSPFTLLRVSFIDPMELEFQVPDLDASFGTAEAARHPPSLVQGANHSPL